jgi:HK97 family phage portal protein
MFITRLRATSGPVDRSAFGEFWFTPIGSQTASGAVVTPNRAMALPVVMACVRVLAESFAILPARCYKGAGRDRKLIAKHWLYELLGRAPNKYQTPFEWREMMMGHIALRGNGYNDIQTDQNGTITSLMPLHPDRMVVKLIDGGGDFDYYYEYTDRSGKVIRYSRSQIWHIRGLSSDGIMGMSPIAVAREAVGMGLSAQEYGARFFANDAQPGGVIEMPGAFKDKAARDQFKGSWQESQTGANRHKVAVLEHNMKYHQLGLNNKDAQFLEARQFTVLEIARMFRVPPHLVGDLSRATFTNIEQQSLDFINNCMTAWAERWESSIERWLFLSDDADTEVEFDFARLTRADRAARASYYKAGINDGWLVRNEARVAEGLEPIDGLDAPLHPLNMVEEGEDAPADDAAPPSGSDTPDLIENPDDGEEGGARARLYRMIHGNAERMARRIIMGNLPSPAILSEALAISAGVADQFLDALPDRTFSSEAQLTAALLALAA